MKRSQSSARNSKSGKDRGTAKKVALLAILCFLALVGIYAYLIFAGMCRTPGLAYSEF